MNILNFYVKLYGNLYNRKGIHYRVLSPFRYVVRELANKHIPYYLIKHPQKPQGKRIENLIVSFTSFPARIDKVWMVVECMKRQTYLPEKIILWLSKDQFPTDGSIPQSLWSRVDELFEIRTVDGDIKSHKKYYYAANEYPDKYLLLIDDDIFYPTDMVEKVIKAQEEYPDAVICRYGYKKTYDSNCILKSYNDWIPVYKDYIGKDFFFGSGGGTLIMPQLLYHDLINRDLFMKLTPTADDVWLNAMANLSGVNIIKISSGLLCPIAQKNCERLSNINLGNLQNDTQIDNVGSYYQERFVFNATGNR